MAHNQQDFGMGVVLNCPTTDSFWIGDSTKLPQDGQVWDWGQN